MASPSNKMACVHWKVTLLLTLTLCHSPQLAFAAETNSSSSNSGSEELGDRSYTGDLQYSEAIWAPVQHSSKVLWEASHSTSNDDAPSYGGDGGNPSEARKNDQLHAINDDKQQSISVSKRAANGISNWGSNPYLLGKRLSNRAFWIPRGKKDVRDIALNPTSERDNAFYYMRDPTYDSLVEPFNNYAASLQYWDDDTSEGESQSEMNENLRRLKMVGETPKRRDRLFWAARGKRQRTEASEDSDDSESYLEKRDPNGPSPQIQKALWKNIGGDGSKFWMSRGRRFWPARGKKAVEPAMFNRFARLVNSDYRDSAYNLLDAGGQSEFVPEHVLGYRDLPASSESLEQPIFWVVRGKKSESSPTNDFSASDEGGVESSWDLPSQMNDREKKAFNDYASALSRLNGREFKVPNFWANRGRKNFWAARGKRAISHLNG